MRHFLQRRLTQYVAPPLPLCQPLQNLVGALSAAAFSLTVASILSTLFPKLSMAVMHSPTTAVAISLKRLDERNDQKEESIVAGKTGDEGRR